MKIASLLLCGASLGILSATAFAQDTNSVREAEATADTSEINGIPGDIIVTAMRREQSLQDVPAVVTAVTSETIEKLNIFKLEEVSALSPGLNLDRGFGGFTASASIRGVTFDSTTAADPTVDIYLNEVPYNPNYALNSIYDIAQIEVLRGPQGTLRGRPSPSGAILLSTRRPDLNDVGGFAAGAMTSRNGILGQAALNVPIISGKLAVRIAGLVDEDDYDRIRSVNNGLNPFRRNRSIRGTVLFQPADTLDFLFTYQEQWNDSRNFANVVGSGLGYNGPVLTARDRAAVSELPSDVHLNGKFYSLQAGWNIDAIQSRLIYTGSFQRQKTRALNDFDQGNSVVNFTPRQDLATDLDTWTHELRLQSENGRILDYTLGLWSFKTEGDTFYTQPTFLSGAFGPPGSRTGPVVNQAYVLPVAGNVKTDRRNKAIFGSVTVHVTDKLDVTGGVRYNIFESNRVAKVDAATARTIAAASAQLGGVCPPALGFLPSLYPGFCDFPVVVGSSSESPQKHKPWTYNASISYQMTPDLMAYASYGHSWREGALNIGLQNQSNPVIAALIFQDPETSDNYEIGIKSTWLDRRLRINATIFQQNFDGQIFRVPSVPYVGNQGPNAALATFDYIVNADSRVRGFELEAAFQIMPNWSIQASGAYADGKIRNQLLPCRDGNLDGVPDAGTPVRGALTQVNPVAFCRSNEAVSNLPKWSSTLQSEVTVPLGGIDSYVRGLFSYYPRNPRADAGFTARSHGLLNLYAGIRAPDGLWDVGLFAKNVMDNRTELHRTPGAIAGIAGLPATGYTQSRSILPREVGLSVRYSFGSR